MPTSVGIRDHIALRAVDRRGDFLSSLLGTFAGGRRMEDLQAALESGRCNQTVISADDDRFRAELLRPRGACFGPEDERGLGETLGFGGVAREHGGAAARG